MNQTDGLSRRADRELKWFGLAYLAIQSNPILSYPILLPISHTVTLCIDEEGGRIT